MNKISKERVTQNRVIKLLKKILKYEYLGNWEKNRENHNIEEQYLRAFLNEKGYGEALITKAIYEFKKAAEDQSKNLYHANKEVYGLLRYGVKVKEGVGDTTQTVMLIDWNNPESNHFAIAEEVTVNGKHGKRPDIVIYVNGIALGVLELKSSIVEVSKGIRQNRDNQKKEFIERFFTTIQLVMAGNDTQGLRYGTIETKERYFLTWKEESQVSNLLDRDLALLCEKNRFLEILHNFIVFDAGTKKLCRHNQYFGVKAAQERIRKREGGIIWHTQGSGKSLTMVWLAKWIHENITDSRVLIITDRIELDEQIEKVFKGVQEDILRIPSGQDLVDNLNAAAPWLMCSLIHKFGAQEEGDVEQYTADIKKNLPKDFKAKGDVYVFVDECHRTQSGELHKAMKSILPNAMFVGFTGTPLLKADKQKSIEIFGSYIHTYKYDEAVKDGVVLDLRYEARDVDQKISSQDKIDLWFEAKTQGLNDIALAQLKQRWGTIKKVLSSKDRLEKIVADILLDFETRDRLKSGHGNALLVSGSIYQACKFYELFQASGFDKCAIVTSYKPYHGDIKGEETGEGYTEKLRQYEIYNKMLDGKDVEVFEKDVKKIFIEEPGQMKLLIVVDKLLTGFDAPSATYLYIDKHMHDHGLFQAICRVNRLDGNDKEYGYVIDYKDLFKSLEGAVTDYTSGAFDTYDKDDVVGLLTNRLDKGKERLEEAREAVKALFESVPPPKGQEEYLHYFCAQDTADKEALKENEPKRIALYKLVVSLIRAYANLANEMAEAGYTAQQAQKIKEEVEYYEGVRTEVKFNSGDYIDLKMYEPAMRHLIDTYIRAEDSRKISAFNNMTLVQLIVERGVDSVKNFPQSIAGNQTAMAESIENNLRRVIIDEQPINPKYYERMSELLDTLIKERKTQALAYEEYLKEIVKLTQQVVDPANSGTAYPKSLKSNTQRAFYDNLGQNEKLALDLDTELLANMPDEWQGSVIKERVVTNIILDALAQYGIEKTDDEVESILDLLRNQER
jgi:type I restriction enzyme R subunit